MCACSMRSRFARVGAGGAWRGAECHKVAHPLQSWRIVIRGLSTRRSSALQMPHPYGKPRYIDLMASPEV
jgi:hypothetical protein